MKKDAESKDIAESHIVGQAKLYILERDIRSRLTTPLNF